jgi:hypothetical protein
MNLAASICPDNLPVKEGLFVLLTNGCPTALLIDMRVFAGNVRFWPIAAGDKWQLLAVSCLLRLTRLAANLTNEYKLRH